MSKPFRFSSLAVIAAGALVATPVAALELPAHGQSSIATGVSDQAGWGHRRHRDNGIDAGDVIAGVLVLGAIAAIAGAGNSRNDRRREERYPEPDYRARDDDRTQMRSNYQSSRGIDSAVSMCVDQIERGDTRVESVDNAARTTDGWRVSGALESGTPWNCWIDNDGRIREIDLAGGASDYSTAPADNGQLSDETYARARAAQRSGTGSASAAVPDGGQQPAYPGGPLPGEEGYEEAVQLSAAR